MLLHPVTQRQLDSLYLHPSHAVGLIGAEGAGKGFIATTVAARILQATHDTFENHPYIRVLDAQTDGTIDEIRELQKFLHLSVPGKGKIRRAVIIEHAEFLGHEAQNALLKTLEEPPKDTIIICTITNRQRLLPTVWSRVQWLTVRSILIDTAIEELASSHTKEETVRAYHMSDGNAALLLTLLANEGDHPLKQAIATAKEILATTKYDRLKMIDQIVKSKEQSSVVEGMRRVLQAAVHINAKRASRENPGELKRLYQQLTLTNETAQLLERKVQPKLALTRLFNSL